MRFFGSDIRIFILCSCHFLSRISRYSCICSPTRHIPQHVRVLKSSLLLRFSSSCPPLRRRWIITNDSDFVSNTVPVLSSCFPRLYYVQSQFWNCLSMTCCKIDSPHFPVWYPGIFEIRVAGFEARNLLQIFLFPLQCRGNPVCITVFSTYLGINPDFVTWKTVLTSPIANYIEVYLRPVAFVLFCFRWT